MKRTEDLLTVHVDLEAGWRGGQRQVLLLCTGLARRGHGVALMARQGGELARRAAAAGLKVIETPAGGGLNGRAVRALTRTIRRRRPAVVGMHSSRSHNVGMIARFLLRGERPLFVVTRRVDFSPGRDPLNRMKYQQGVDGYIAISHAVENKLVATGVPRGRIRIVHSGVEAPVVPFGARSEVRDELGIAEETLLLGVVAALTDHKGHLYLLKAMPRVLAEFPGTVLLLVGDGELREELGRLAEDLGIARKTVRFLGYRPDVHRVLGALDLFVMPSKLEGLGTSVMDAMLAGVPVVTTRAGGLPELIEDGITGLLTEASSPESLASGIIEALGDAELRAGMADHARTVAQGRFTADTMVEGTLEAYRGLLMQQRAEV